MDKVVVFESDAVVTAHLTEALGGLGYEAIRYESPKSSISEVQEVQPVGVFVGLTEDNLRCIDWLCIASPISPIVCTCETIELWMQADAIRMGAFLIWERRSWQEMEGVMRAVRKEYEIRVEGDHAETLERIRMREAWFRYSMNGFNLGKSADDLGIDQESLRDLLRVAQVS